jgi:hypothetical protein
MVIENIVYPILEKQVFMLNLSLLKLVYLYSLYGIFILISINCKSLNITFSGLIFGIKTIRYQLLAYLKSFKNSLFSRFLKCKQYSNFDSLSNAQIVNINYNFVVGFILLFLISFSSRYQNDLALMLPN